MALSPKCMQAGSTMAFNDHNMYIHINNLETKDVIIPVALAADVVMLIHITITIMLHHLLDFGPNSSFHQLHLNVSTSGPKLS